MRIKILLLGVFFALNLSAITVGEVPKKVVIDGENGGAVKGDVAWDSSSIKEKVYILFYIDPDEKDTNEHFSKKLKAKKYDTQNYGSIAIVNLAATWKPNFVIESILAKKQKEYTNTIYVKDKNSVLVNEWEIADNASDILLFSKEGKLLFYKSGRLSDGDIETVFRLIEENL